MYHLTASQAPIWTVCTAQPRAVECTRPPRETSPLAERGKESHQYAQLLVHQERVPDTPPAHQARRAVTHAQPLLQDLEWVRTEWEVGFTYRALQCPRGRADVVGKAQATLLVLDWKFGARVAAANNPQLILYGYGAWLQLTDQERTQVKWWRLAIAQPTGVRDIVIPVSAGIVAIEHLERIARGVQTGGEYTPGTHCTYCAVKPWCPAYAAAPTPAPFTLTDDTLVATLARRHHVSPAVVMEWCRTAGFPVVRERREGVVRCVAKKPSHRSSAPPRS